MTYTKPAFTAPTSHRTAQSALAQVQAIYAEQIGFLRQAMKRFVAGENPSAPYLARYHFVRMHTRSVAPYDSKLDYGVVEGPGHYGTKLTSPASISHY